MLLSRQEYYDVHGLPRLLDLLAAMNKAWPLLRLFRGAAIGDESIVPHKQKRAGPVRHFMPRKPRRTSIKLYMLADTVHLFVANVYLLAGKCVWCSQVEKQV